MNSRPPLDPAVSERIARSWDQATTGPVSEAWVVLEDAHILSQPWAGLHARTHLEMLRLAVRSLDVREIVGQTVRLVVAAPGSLTGRYPTGNTGRSNVSMLQPMPVRPELAALLAGDSVGEPREAAR